MFLAEVDISKTAYFMMTQNFSQVVTKFIPCDDVTRFDGMVPSGPHRCPPLPSNIPTPRAGRRQGGAQPDSVVGPAGFYYKYACV